MQRTLLPTEIKRDNAFTSVYMPILYLVVLSVVAYSAARTGLSKINAQRSQIADEKKIENILKEKDSEIREMQPVVASYVNQAVEAVPERNPALQIMNHVNKISTDKNFIVEEFGIAVNKEVEQTVQTVPISFNFLIPKGEVLDVYSKFDNTLPIIVVSELDITLDQSDSARIKTIASSFWGPFPKELPPIDTPIEKINETDLGFLKNLSGRTMPEFTFLEPMAPGSRENPFKY